MNTINIFKLDDEAKTPYKAHKEDACFDLFLNLKTAKSVPCSYVQVDSDGQYITIDTCLMVTNGMVEIPPMSSVILPTGICMGIPEGYRVDINARSGRAAKYMQNLTNGVGVIDAGYKDEIKVMLHNNSGSQYTLKHHDKIAQFHLEKVLPTTLNEISDIDQLSSTSNRKGGLGSTGDN